MALGTSVGKVAYGYQPPQAASGQSNSGGPLSSVYDAAATTQAGDYDNIMSGYDDLLKRTKAGEGQNNLNYIPINPVFQDQLKGTPYQRSNELNTALTGLEDFSRTGGYSDADIGNIRERAISPIRSIYSSAQDAIRRQKVLSGGYSPNQGALQAKLARESSARIGDITTNANAQIAQMIQSGKLSGLTALSGVAGRDNELSNAANVRNNELENEVSRSNTGEQRRVDELNAQMQQYIDEINNRNAQQDTQTELNALGGKTSLYGTTPALTQTFGNQVLANNAQTMQAVNTANQIKDQRANLGLNLVQSSLRSTRPSYGV